MSYLRHFFLTALALLIVSIAIIVACKGYNRPESFVDNASYIRYAMGNKDFLKEVTLDNGVKISAMLIPNTFVFTNDSAHTGFQDNLYFMLSFSKNNKELLSQIPADEYSALLHTLSFGMENLVSLLPNGQKKRIYPIGSSFQPTYGLGNSNDVIVVFSKSDLARDQDFNVILDGIDLQSQESEFFFRWNDVIYVSSLNISKPHRDNYD